MLVSPAVAVSQRRHGTREDSNGFALAHDAQAAGDQFERWSRSGTAVVDIAEERRAKVGKHHSNLMEPTSLKADERVGLGRAIERERHREHLKRCRVAARTHTPSEPALSAHETAVATDQFPERLVRRDARDVPLRPTPFAHLRRVLRGARAICRHDEDARGRAVEAMRQLRVGPSELVSGARDCGIRAR